MKARRPTPPRYPARRRKGRCFELAGRGLLEIDPTWTLVHGRAAFWNLTRLPLLIAHAWLEKGGYVYDATLDELLTVKAYATRHSAIAERRYTEAKARKQLLAARNWGPWHPSQQISVAPQMLARALSVPITGTNVAQPLHHLRKIERPATSKRLGER